MDSEFNLLARENLKRHARDCLYDLVVIGGGIVGSGVARDAALRGLSVAVVEAGDIASGTSSRSSRLIHGGLRYLEHFKLGLVHESVTERWRLMKMAPHLSWPMPFFFPAYKGESPGLHTMSAGTLVYSLLSAFRTPGPRQIMGRQTALRTEPNLLATSLKGAVKYYDCATNDARLTLETAMDAAECGAHVFPHARALSMVDDGNGVAMEVQDSLHDDRLTFKAKVVVVAAGPWTDSFLGQTMPGWSNWLRPTKGTHLVFPREKLPVSHAVVMKTRADQRMTFTVPAGNFTYVGTTDTDCPDPMAPLETTAEDANYLLDAINDYFPTLGLAADDVVGCWAGIRPLVAPADEVPADQEVDPSDVSREEKYETYRDRYVVVAGGKLTTYRVMARKTVDQVARLLTRHWQQNPGRCSTATRPLPGGVNVSSVALLGRQFRHDYPGLPAEWLEHLANRYGTRGAGIAAMAGKKADLLAPLPGGGAERLAEVHFAALAEYCVLPEDFLLRRSHLHFEAKDGGLAAAAVVCETLTKLDIMGTDRAAAVLTDYSVLAAAASRLIPPGE